MRSGLSMMYAQQAPAFSARDSLITDLGPSTPDSPPVFTSPDLEGLTALKKRIVENLPTNCTHCNAALFPECFQELKDGSVMAYCKTKGACGKSLVLFASVDLRRPNYRKICPFQKSTPPPPVLEMQVATGDSAQQEVPAISITEVQQYEQRFTQRDMYDLHGITRPTEICALCETIYDLHEHVACDRHGWVVANYDLLTLPADWPVYDSRSHTWAPRTIMSSIFQYFG